MQSTTTINVDPTTGMLVLFGALALVVLLIVAMWKTFQKAGKPGWASIVPIYNTIVMLQIGGLSPWFVLLMLIPYVNIVMGIVATIYFGKAFGKRGLFQLGLIFLPFIFVPILGFGKAQYVYVSAPAGGDVPPPPQPPQPQQPYRPYQGGTPQ